MLFRTRTAASRLLAAMWLKASSRSHSAFGLRLARIMSGGAKPPCSWPGPHSRASRRAVARALASSRLRTPRCPPRAPTASGSDMINDDSPVKVRPTVPQESSRARETLQATFATKGCRVPTPRSVWSAVPQGTAFDRRADLPVRVPMLRRCPACRKAPARAGAVHTMLSRFHRGETPFRHRVLPPSRRGRPTIASCPGIRLPVSVLWHAHAVELRRRRRRRRRALHRARQVRAHGNLRPLRQVRRGLEDVTEVRLASRRQ